jgi:hypothetical protein
MGKEEEEALKFRQQKSELLQQKIKLIKREQKNRTFLPLCRLYSKQKMN